MILRHALQNCKQLVRERAYHDSYLPLICHNARLRPMLWPIHALQLDLAGIADLPLQSPQLQRMRWLWWKERVIAIITSPTLPSTDNEVLGGDNESSVNGNPVLKGLHFSLCAGESEQRRFLLTSFFRGHEQWLQLEQMTSIEQLEQIADQTLGSVLRLQLELIRQHEGTGSEHAIAEDHIASHVAKAMQLCRTIRSVRADGRLFKRCRLPAKLMAEHRLSTHQLLRWLQSEESEDASTAVAKQLREIIYELASTAHLHLETAHKHLQELCPSRAELRQQQLQSLQLFIMPPKRYLELLQRNEFDLIVSGKRLPEFDLLLHWRFLRETFV